MANIVTSPEQLIGRTPMVELPWPDMEARLLAKLELWNLTGSVKDRPALAMIRDAEARGLLQPGGVIIEPTSGNTGVALAALAAAGGYRCIIVMPDSMSPERRLLTQAYGAELVLTPGNEGMTGAIQKAAALAQEIPGSFIPGQFHNPANPQAHYDTTGPEIWADTEGNVDIFVAGVGSGGTISGVGRYLKEQNPAVQVVAAEPASSPLLSAGRVGSHGLQGLGANFIPAVLDTGIIDAVIPVTEAEAYTASRLLARREGILAGISSGAALHAAMTLGKMPAHHGKTIVTLLPDGGTRYLSVSGLFDRTDE